LQELGKEGYRVKPMDVAKDENLWQKYNIQGTPTFIAANGDTLVGFREKPELKNWLDAHTK
jgi:protein-disulfide isomerase